MFKHEKQLLQEVRVERANPQYAVLLQEQLGGGNGELKAAMQYITQSLRVEDPEIKDLFLDIGAEELSQLVRLFLDGGLRHLHGRPVRGPSEQHRLRAARQGGV